MLTFVVLATALVSGTSASRLQFKNEKSGHIPSLMSQKSVIAPYDNFAGANAAAAKRAGANDATGFLKDLMNYGNWCGGGHGGFQDCCDGKPCPSCVLNRTADDIAPLTDACLEECPIKDELDAACARHDHCTFQFEGPRHLKCVPQGNFCPCDCTLLAEAQASTCGFLDLNCYTYRFGLEALFKGMTDCWFDDYARGVVTCLEDVLHETTAAGAKSSTGDEGNKTPSKITDFC
ncbi:hypothetical protein SARC_03318 [Sphaeroforma arctica JP610]|uniref:Phospholipase A2 domain-containing protein n=1 Tax=Sphaeroforma arctica JP610 TaxID=667725 RepID=A0A0L0G683_9EUKA|nr:hypothetical protein SARC_03318 [Sphaeroforma arctica JP610]KNC84454.1 hypothetical protein SARC_03318 [Sphaeroforma arctica JP610]|eukprot:XP_014158356.1 hypothetical protein SARC_03318 [Sphaeroforma arctica JP610]